MNIKSERGQAEIAIVLILAIVVIAAFFGMLAANQRGTQAGADAIGEAAGEAIDNATRDQELENEIWIAQNAVAAWVGGQRALQPNEHAVLNHGDDAWATVRCYNKNGTFHIMSTKNDGFHLLCRDDEGSVRDLILKRRAKNSNEFDMVNAYTPQDGTQREVMPMSCANSKPEKLPCQATASFTLTASSSRRSATVCMYNRFHS